MRPRSAGVEKLLIVGVVSRLFIYAAVLPGETVRKNYQSICDTFLYCVFRKF